MMTYFNKYNNSVNCFELVGVNKETGRYNSFNYNVIEYKGSKYLLKFSDYNRQCEPVTQIKRLKELGYKEYDITAINLPLWNPNFLTDDERYNSKFFDSLVMDEAV